MWRKPDEPKVSSPSIAPATSSPASATSSDFPAPQADTPSVASASSTPSNRVVSSAPSATVALLTSSIIVKGEISGREDLYVDGEVHGKIQIVDGKVTIGPNGRVSADIDAREILVRGKVQGSVHGRERVEIAATGDVQGDVLARRLVIEEGAILHGSIEVEKATVAAEVAPTRVVRVAVAEAPRPVAEAPRPVAFENVEP